MTDIEDWLKDPLIEIVKGSYQYRKLKNADGRQQDLWQSFHFSTRLKLDGSDYFCRQVLGAASMPDECGLPLLAHRLLEWNLGAFFFELMSAHDTLLQELNIIYAYDLALNPEKVRWDTRNTNKFMEKLPQEIYDDIKAERTKTWFIKVSSYRNMATHHYLVPIGSEQAGSGTQPLDYEDHKVFIILPNKTGEVKPEDVNICNEYLKSMARHITSVWEKISHEFE